MDTAGLSMTHGVTPNATSHLNLVHLQTFPWQCPVAGYPPRMHTAAPDTQVSAQTQPPQGTLLD